MRIPNLSVLSASLLLFLAAKVIASSPPAQNSPSVSETDLICPTSSSLECYPRVFSPTPEFQTIQPDQHLPPGLHVRLNLETGLKEARLNIPLEENQAKIEASVFTETNAVAIVPDPDTDGGPNGDIDGLQSGPSSLDRSGKTPPPYSSHGRIPQPQDPSSGSTFETSVSELLSQRGDTVSALEDLEDLAHDIYYGVEVTKNREVVNRLVDLMTSVDTNGKEERAQVSALAALVLSNALQNNPAALGELETHEIDVTRRVIKALEETSRMDKATNVKTQERLVSVLGRFMQSESGLIRFIKSSGFESLYSIFDVASTGRDGRDGVRARMALLVTDHFLDGTVHEVADYVRGDQQTQLQGVSGSHQTQETAALWCEAFKIAHQQMLKAGTESQDLAETFEKASRSPGCISLD
ncbi:MAG: hypothetical protein M4579_003969 [Chaenotheca gracillima]|nr:MAG: hypothetical protein M4579_003969 [Chaenotheca gracillima]